MADPAAPPDTAGRRFPRVARLIGVEVAILTATALEVLPFGLPGDPLLDLSVLALFLALPLRLVAPELAVVLGSFGTSWAFSLIGPAVLTSRLAYRRRNGWVVLLWCTVGVAISVTPFWQTGDGAVQINVTSLATAAAIFGGGAAIGRLRRSREEQRAAYRDLLHSQETQRRLAAEAARAEERAMMAREMHDVVSHQISLIALQSGALRTASTSPEVTAAAETIRRLAVRANLELRQLLTALRSAETGGPASMPHTLDQLDALWTSSGLPGELSVRGRLADVPPLVQSACYRAAQEGLSNACKHAPGSRVTLTCDVDDDEVTCTVTNTAPLGRPAADLSNGLGLLGLRERVTVLGGSLTAGSRLDGGYRLRVTFPPATPVCRLTG